MRKLEFIIFTLLILFAAFSTPCFATSIQSKMAEFNDANRLYEKNDFAAASEKYRALSDSGFVSGSLYFNMGDTYYRLGRIGPAILFYRRAQRLMPRDEELEENLAYVHALVIDEAKKQETITINERFISVLRLFTANELSVTASLMFFMAMISACFAVYSDSLKQRKYFRDAFLALFIASLIPAASLGIVVVKDMVSPDAVVTANRVEVKAGPGDDFATVFILHEGSEVSSSRKKDDWRKIIYPSVGNGWVKMVDVEEVK